MKSLVYSSATKQTINHFLRIAEERDWNVNIHNGISKENLLLFLAFKRDQMVRGELLASSLYSHLSNLSRFHAENSIDWAHIRQHPEVMAFLRFSIKPIRPRFARKERAPAVTLRELEEFCASLDSSVADDIVFGACASILFWGLGRLTEIFHATTHSPLRVSSLVERDSVFQIYLERPKVPKDYDQFLVSSDLDTCSSSSFWLYLLQVIKQESLPDDPLWLLESGMVVTRKVFLERFTSILGYSANHFDCSSFRAGGATEMLARGVPVDILRLRGRWSSQAWERYIRLKPVQLNIASGF